MGHYRLLDIEGQIHAGMGNFDLAEHLFRQSAEGFKESGILGHEALASLHLATAVLRQNDTRYAEAVRLIVNALNTFSQLQLRPQVSEALDVLLHAIHDGLLTATLLQSVTDFLRLADRDRRARFEPRF